MHFDMQGSCCLYSSRLVRTSDENITHPAEVAHVKLSSELVKSFWHGIPGQFVVIYVPIWHAVVFFWMETQT